MSRAMMPVAAPGVLLALLALQLSMQGAAVLAQKGKDVDDACTAIASESECTAATGCKWYAGYGCFAGASKSDDGKGAAGGGNGTADSKRAGDAKAGNSTQAPDGTISRGNGAGSVKILCLHGGGGNGAGFAAAVGMQALVSSNPDVEFVFATSPIGSGVWWEDPPGGKGAATTDPAWAAASLAALDAVVAAQGPFAGILGYSQGSAAVPVYLAHAPAGTFQFAAMFCGFLTTTHVGLLDAVTAASPFDDIPALVWMGANDITIANELTQAQAAKFSSPTVLTSPVGGHDLPTPTDTTYTAVQEFVAGQVSLASTAATGTAAPIPTTVAGAGSKNAFPAAIAVSLMAAAIPGFI